MNSTEINLGDIVKYLQIKPEPRDRIINLIQSDDYLQSILKKYGFFDAKLQKDLKLNGYNIESLKKEVLKRLPSRLNNENDKMWFFYRTAIIFFLQSELPNLNDLLKKTKIQKKDYSSRELLEIIKSHTKNFKVSDKDFYKLYNYWPFERIENENDIFDFLNEEKNLIVEKKEKVELKNSNDDFNVEKEIESIKKNTEKIISSKNSELEKKLNSKINEIQNIVQQTEIEKGLLKELQAKVSKVSDKNLSIENEIPKIKKELTEISRDLHIEFNKKVKDLEDRLLDFTKKENAQILNVLNDRVDDIAKSLHLKNHKIFEGELKLNFQDERKRTLVKNEEVFFSAWLEHLSESGINISSDEALIAHIYFKSCSYLIVDEYAVLESWLTFTGFHEFTNVETVAPLWTDRLDWYGTSRFLESSENDAKFAIFRNFDLGMTSSYIYPTLDKWLAARINTKHKVFLIPSIKNEDALPYKEVLAVAPVLKVNELISTSPKQWKHHNLNLHKNLPLINEDILKTWIKNSNEADYRNEILVTPSRSLNIKLPDSLLLNFNSINSNLRKYFTEEESLFLAIESTFRPFIVAVYGEEIFNKYHELIRAFR